MTDSKLFNNQEEPEFVSIPVSNHNESYVNQRYEIIDIISRGYDSDSDYLSEDELVKPINLINDLDVIDRPSTPINQGIKKRPPPNQKLLYSRAKKIRNSSE